MSIRFRLLLAASLVLLLFVLITGIALQRASLNDAMAAQEERMQGLSYALLGAVEIDEAGTLQLVESEVPEPRLSTPDSGLYALILDHQGNPRWQSPSVTGASQQAFGPTEVGRWQFTRASQAADNFVLAFGVRWVSIEPSPQYSLVVLENAGSFYQARQQFNRNLWSWLLAPAGLLLILQLAVLSWSLGPLNRLVAEIVAIEKRTRDQVTGVYPRELSGLQKALNTLLRQERHRQQTYKQSLDDLAHSLKTPLSIMRNTLDESVPDKNLLTTQIGRMGEIITHRLKKAAAASTTLLPPAIDLFPFLERFIASMAKVYPGISLSLDHPQDSRCRIRIDESDLYELVGNLLDNACKWADSTVQIELACDATSVCIRITDDGPGFAGEDLPALLKRGVRADAQPEGQGLGLSLCADMVKNLGGSIQLGNAAAGGAEVTVCLPG